MDTRDMPDETVLPGHQYSLGEMRNTIKVMRDVAHKTYWMMFGAKIGAYAHAMLEFNGLISKYIDLCEEALKQGVEFPFANRHGGKSLPIDLHHAEYLGEKFECIYGFVLAGNPELRKAFERTAFEDGAQEEIHDAGPAKRTRVCFRDRAARRRRRACTRGPAPRVGHAQDVVGGEDEVRS